MNRIRRTSARAALLLIALTMPSALGLTLAGAAGADTSSPAAPVSISKTDADRESHLVAGEDRRLQDLRTITTLARWQNRAQRAPYRVGTPAGYTLVLTARSEPYVLADLLQLAPQTLVRLSDGSYLLSEHVVVMDGAELDLTTPGLTLRLASSPQGFVSIVSMGGRLRIVGTAGHPVRITSWDTRLGALDKTTVDGRAYVRAIGGQVQASYVKLQSLGFWSGRTGGLALTGTDRPNTGALDVKAAKAATSSGSVGGINILPTGALPSGSATPSDSDIYANTFVTARIDHTEARGNAFGLFASGADGILLVDSTFLDSQITGVDFHRFVTGSTIQRTVSSHSGGDGFSLGRATEGVQITQCTADRNAADGFVISGEPLADGPSAVGSPTTVYGNSLVGNSTAANNGHYGVYLRDGFNMTVTGNHITGGRMGVVAGEGARHVSINGNDVGWTTSHGIALLDHVSTSTVTGNLVHNAPIYLRDSQAEIRGNTVLAATGHAISIVGSSDGTAIENNVVAGAGSSAIDVARAHGNLTETDNSATAWHDTTSIFVRAMHTALHPMSLLWAAILGFVLLSMIKGVRRRKTTPGVNPYAHQSAHLHAVRA